MYRFIPLLVLLFFVSGCALFRSGLRLPPVEMVRVPGGTFTMGDVFNEKDDDATPVHEVTLPPFYISKYEITYAQYDAWAEQAGWPLPEDDGFGRGNRAVTNVTWDEAAAFCAAYGYRLPTEPEWEYAARGGGLRQRFAGTDSTEAVQDYARIEANTTGGAFYSFYVGSKKPNALGLHDMSGNVFEWVGGYYPYYPKPGDTPEWYPLEERGMRLMRGGSFKSQPEFVQTYRRVGTLRDVRANDIGFRCAQSGK